MTPCKELRCHWAQQPAVQLYAMGEQCGFPWENKCGFDSMLLVTSKQ